MSLISAKTKLKNDLEASIKKASKDALIEADKIATSESNEASDLSTAYSNKFSTVFSKNLSEDLSEIIYNYVKGATVEHALTAPNGPVKGVIKLI